MKKQEFIEKGINLTKVLEENGIVRPAKKGEHVGNFVGFCVWPGTERHWERIWQKYGNIMNFTVLNTAEEVRSILSGVDFVKVTPTKSGRFCRLRIF